MRFDDVKTVTVSGIEYTIYYIEYYQPATRYEPEDRGLEIQKVEYDGVDVTEMTMDMYVSIGHHYYPLWQQFEEQIIN